MRHPVRNAGRSTLLAFSLLFAGLASAFAQTAAIGLVEGRVSNPGTGEFLELARISIEGTALETLTDATVQYRLANVPAGAVRVRAFRTGMVPDTRAVTVAVGRSIEPGTYNWGSKRMLVDVITEFSLTRRFSLFANLHNIGDAPSDLQIFGPSTPAEAQFRQRTQFGSLWTIGLRGSF
jgi:hypothetical protein